MDLNKVFKCISWTSRGECFRVRAGVIAGGHSGPVQLLRELGSIFCSKSDLFLVRVGPVMNFVTDSVYNFCGENFEEQLGGGHFMFWFLQDHVSAL